MRAMQVNLIPLISRGTLPTYVGGCVRPGSSLAQSEAVKTRGVTLIQKVISSHAGAECTC